MSSGPHARAEGEPTRACFTLATWNTFGAAQGPLALLRGRGATEGHRLSHPELERALAAVDVLCLQELWLAEATAAFTRALPHRALASNHATLWPLTLGGSGLGVASRFPLVHASFKDYSRPHVGSERFARKGLAHARLAVPTPGAPAEVDVITTHLQAGYGDGARAVRARHLRELRAFAEAVGDASRPMVVCGDLNVDGRAHRRDAEYAAVAEVFSGYLDVFAEPDHPTYHPGDNGLARRFEPGGPVQRIDYVLLRESGRRLRVERAEVFLERPLPPRAGYPATHASDHYGLRLALGLPDAG